MTWSDPLRWAIAVGMVPLAALCLLAAPASGGLSLILGVPAGLTAAWMFRNRPADREQIGFAGAVALGLGVAVVCWVVFALLTDRTIWGAPQ